MSCYECGSYGHKKDKCPKRIKKIKCYECNEYGHYKNECPIILEQLKRETALKREREHQLWVQEKLPDLHKVIKNKAEVLQFLKDMSESDQHSGYWSCFGCIYITIKDKVTFSFNCFTEVNVRPLLTPMTVDEFLSLIERKGLHSQLWYQKVKISLNRMIHELADASIITTKKEGNITNYYLDGHYVMRYRNKENPDVDVYDQHTKIICDAYDDYKQRARDTFEANQKIELNIIFE